MCVQLLFHDLTRVSLVICTVFCAHCAVRSNIYTKIDQNFRSEILIRIARCMYKQSESYYHCYVQIDSLVSDVFWFIMFYQKVKLWFCIIDSEEKQRIRIPRANGCPCRVPSRWNHSFVDFNWYILVYFGYIFCIFYVYFFCIFYVFVYSYILFVYWYICLSVLFGLFLFGVIFCVWVL